jgi:hypothetical protein
VWADTLRHALLGAVKKPSPVFKEVVMRHLALKREGILADCAAWEKEIRDHQPRAASASASKPCANPQAFAMPGCQAYPDLKATSAAIVELRTLLQVCFLLSLPSPALRVACGFVVSFSSHSDSDSLPTSLPFVSNCFLLCIALREVGGVREQGLDVEALCAEEGADAEEKPLARQHHAEAQGAVRRAPAVRHAELGGADEEEVVVMGSQSSYGSERGTAAARSSEGTCHGQAAQECMVLD